MTLYLDSKVFIYASRKKAPNMTYINNAHAEPDSHLLQQQTESARIPKDPFRTAGNALSDAKNLPK